MKAADPRLTSPPPPSHTHSCGGGQDTALRSLHGSHPAKMAADYSRLLGPTFLSGAIPNQGHNSLRCQSPSRGELRTHLRPWQLRS